MVFTLISEIQEYLNQAVEDEKKSREEEILQKLKEAEKAELVRNIIVIPKIIPTFMEVTEMLVTCIFHSQPITIGYGEVYPLSQPTLLIFGSLLHCIYTCSFTGKNNRHSSDI